MLKRSNPAEMQALTSPAPTSDRAPFWVALTGNPNCGKSTLFNALTGLRAKVGNYAGVTVERKEGRLLHVPQGREINLLDLPGTYSLSPKSLDERIARDVLLGRLKEVSKPDLVVVVLDASNLERNLYYATQVIELGYPTLLVLNMMDVASDNGSLISAEILAENLGVPVIPMIASMGQGVEVLRAKIISGEIPERSRRAIPEHHQLVKDQIAKISAIIRTNNKTSIPLPEATAELLLGDERTSAADLDLPNPVHDQVLASRLLLQAEGIDWTSATIEARYTAIHEIFEKAVTGNGDQGESFSDKLDHILTHKFWGVLIFIAIMTAMFQSIFTLAEYPKHWIETAVNLLSVGVGNLIPPGDLHSLIVDGAIAGVGSIITFLPQICLLFLFIGLLEDTGYMARAAFLMDRLMSRVGLHGKSFIPMLSSFACAIPGILATRTIENAKDRLATILVAPLMSCSARLPVYTLLIAACIPEKTILGVLKLSALTMLAMYLLGIIVALLMAWLFKKTLLRGEPPLLIMELPPYKRPMVKMVLRHMWDRSKMFLRRAGTVILGISILLWFLATYPRHPEFKKEFEAKRTQVEQQFANAPDPKATESALLDLERTLAGEQLRQSYAGKLGHLIEPVIAPLGFDWKIGIGIIASFAAREVFVSTMSTVYNVGGPDQKEDDNVAIAKTLQRQVRPDGGPVYTPLLGVTLMVFYVFALQCASTVAVVRRETNSWKWPAFQWLYMGVLAWGLAFITYRLGLALGWN